MPEPTDYNGRLKQILKQNGFNRCPSCRRELDQGDMAWNNASTESGTGYCSVVCQCQQCDYGIFEVRSWYPEITDLEDICIVLQDELGNNRAIDV